ASAGKAFLSLENARLIERQLQQDVAVRAVVFLPLDELVLERADAALRSAPPQLFLRAADALQLACATVNGHREIYSHDRHVIAAARHFGLRGIDVITGR